MIQLFIRDYPACTGQANLIRPIVPIVCSANHDARLPICAIQICIKQYKFNTYLFGCLCPAFNLMPSTAGALRSVIVLKYPKYSKIYAYQICMAELVSDDVSSGLTLYYISGWWSDIAYRRAVGTLPKAKYFSAEVTIVQRRPQVRLSFNAPSIFRQLTHERCHHLWLRILDTFLQKLFLCRRASERLWDARICNINRIVC